ncbi:hypothetical protein GY45DRAFT_746828 [Cubamyces sp. BRFM 1775]|nr:hypothetical protein GY45DRAFT_746828 [Cubamyces sp. BRFM 1775]
MISCVLFKLISPLLIIDPPRVRLPFSSVSHRNRASAYTVMRSRVTLTFVSLFRSYFHHYRLQWCYRLDHYIYARMHGKASLRRDSGPRTSRPTEHSLRTMIPGCSKGTSTQSHQPRATFQCVSGARSSRSTSSSRNPNAGGADIARKYLFKASVERPHTSSEK